MIIKPRIRGFVCLTAHPVGCETHVREQIKHVTAGGKIETGPKNVLVLGASTGYGLSSRITAAFGSGASTLGVFFEKEPTEKRTATAGWYNSVAFEKLAKEAGLKCKSLNGDAFSDEISGVHDLSSDAYALVLITALPLKTQTTPNLSDFTEVSNGGGYTTGGIALTESWTRSGVTTTFYDTVDPS